MPPSTYSGPFSEYYSRYVEPHLPSPKRVAEFDQILRSYLKTDDPVYVARFVKSQMRGQICETSSGAKILPTDNSPVWWLHEYLCSGAPQSTNPEFFSKLPAHMFKLPKDRKYLNETGFHAAHLLNAKDGNVDWRNWDRSELARRTLKNIHPCNMFLVSKVEWGIHGGRPDILRWITKKYLDRYGDVMRSFLNDVGYEVAQKVKITDPYYEYDVESFLQPIVKSENIVRNSSNETTNLRRLSRPQINKENLRNGIVLEIKTGNEVFLIDHDLFVEWVGENLNALNTMSWIKRGEYHWPNPTKKMLEFLKNFRV